MKFVPLLLVLLALAGHAPAQNMPGMPMPKGQEPYLTQSAPGAAQMQGAVVEPRAEYVGKRVEYDLYVDDRLVNFTGKTRHAIGINGQIPAPTLRFTEGDTAVIRVHNLMHMETSIHWHGILLPNQYDGMPYLTTAPIMPGGTHTFTFPLIQSGT